MFFLQGMLHYFLPGILRYFLPGFAVSLLFLLIFEVSLQVRKEKVSWSYRMIILLTGIYLTWVFSITVSPDYVFSLPDSAKDVNLIPFKVLNTASDNPLNFWGNIMMFTPLGISLVLLSKKCQKLFVALMIGAELSVSIELLQLFSIRSTDIDDVILNTLGTLCGFFVGKLILFFVPSLRKNIGIIKNVDGKLYRKHNDTGNIILLSIIAFSAVFFTGILETHDELRLPLISKDHTVVIEQPSEAPASKEILADVDARNAVLLDVTTNTILYKKESEQKIAPASTTKMLTALTALDYCNEDDEVLIGEEINLIASDASKAWLNTGDRLTVRQLLDAILLPSGNDAAYALAVHTGRKIGGDEKIPIQEAVEVFVDAMNKKAAYLGAKDSNFTSPDGYDDEGQYTTAHDLACIAKSFLRSDLLRGIVGSYEISDRWLSGKQVTYNNTNELINPDSQYYYPKAAGLKTGKSEAAGCCLVSAAYIRDKLYLCVVMGSTEEGRWIDSITLYDEIKQ